MLKKIHFSCDDKLILLGDYIDREPESFTYNAGKAFQYCSQNGKKRFFCIDCGCSYNHTMSQLAYIRLDDEHVFYVSR